MNFAAEPPAIYRSVEDNMEWKESADLPDSFFDRVSALAARYSWNPIHLLKVWMSESGIRSKAWNKSGDASGIFQLMPETAKGLGWSLGMEAYRGLSVTDQVGWAERYYRQYTAFNLDSPERFYLATFMPALLADKASNKPTYVICGQRGPFAWAYSANKVFDTENKGYITVGDLGKAINRSAVGPRWNEVAIRMAKAEEETTNPDTPLPRSIPSQPVAMLSSWTSIQLELQRRGLYKGRVDGIAGRMTMEAVAMLLAS